MRWLRNGTVTEYEATDTDALVLAQAIAREGRPHNAVAWTLVQRFALLFPRYDSLAGLVRAYAQPVNPRWFPDGDKHKARMRQLEGDKAAQEDEHRRAHNRLTYAKVPWKELPKFARAFALEAIEGGESPVPGSVHFRASLAPKGANKRRAFERATRYAAGRTDLVDVVRLADGYGKGVNWFFTSAGAVQMLADDDDPLIPKGATPGELPGAPEGLPTGEGWGWAWCFSPSFSRQPESVGAESPQDSAAADPEASQKSSGASRFDEAPPTDEPGPDDDETERGRPRNPGPDDELPPGPVVSIADARTRYPEIAAGLEGGDEDDDDDDEGEDEGEGEIEMGAPA